MLVITGMLTEFFSTKIFYAIHIQYFAKETPPHYCYRCITI